MLDVQNPEINVEDIMRRIQDKVRQRQEAAAAQPILQAVRPAESSLPAQSVETIDLHLAQAREFSQVGATLPSMSETHGLKRALAGPIAKVFLRVAQLITRDQRQFNQSILGALQALRQAFADGLGQQAAETAQLGARLNLEVRATQELSGQTDALGRNLSAVAREVSAAAQDLGALTQRVATEQARRIDELELRMATWDSRVLQSEHQLANERHAHSVQLGQVRTAVTLQERRLTLLLEETKKRLPQALDEKQLKAFADELPHVPDASYLHFEDEFRGSREDIKSRVAIYIPKLRAAQAGSDRAPILDLGCGRGELLEVLRAEGLKASGVDSNSAAVDQCRELKLEVVIGDLFEVLAKAPDGSLGAVTAMHVVEHLPFPLLLKLLDETLRVLRPGGIAIFETPNPQNILVGASNFYLDPTHRNPVHPQTLRYLVEARGMIQVESLMLHPYPKEMHLPEDTPVARIFNEYFYGPQDYAVLGRRP